MGNLPFVARTNMVNNQISPSEVTDQDLMGAMLKVPRELFVPNELIGIAYADTHIPLGNGRNLVAPANFARLAQLAKISEHDKVLDVGCGTGYSTAIFANLAKKVIAIEPDEKLASGANYTLNQLGIRNVIIISEPLLDGHPEDGPYDVIFINGSVNAIPDALVRQLSDGGRLVAVVQKKGKPGDAVLVECKMGAVSQRKVFGVTTPPLVVSSANDDQPFTFND